MSNKTVSINPKPRRPEPDPAILDALVQGKAATPAPAAPPVQEEGRGIDHSPAAPQAAPKSKGRGEAVKTPMKRLTFDIPADLHKRIRRACLEKEVDMTVELRRILQEHFPA
jgi:hypothetical protein